jgi:hypothetical protein
MKVKNCNVSNNLSSSVFSLSANIQGSGAFAVLDDKIVQKTLMSTPGNSKVNNQTESSKVVRKMLLNCNPF